MAETQTSAERLIAPTMRAVDAAMALAPELALVPAAATPEDA